MVVGQGGWAILGGHVVVVVGIGERIGLCCDGDRMMVDVWGWVGEELVTLASAVGVIDGADWCCPCGAGGAGGNWGVVG